MAELGVDTILILGQVAWLGLIGDCFLVFVKKTESGVKYQEGEEVLLLR